MREPIVAVSGTLLTLGVQGETDVQAVWFPISDWREQHGQGVFTLVYQRFDDEQGYPVAITVGDENVEWVVQSADTAKPGLGRCELIYTVGGAVAKSVVYDTFVSECVDGSAEPPEPWESWVEHITGEIAKVTDMTVEAETLSAGSEATVTKTVGDVVNLAFGIPRGQNGSKGDPGEKGDPGIPGSPGADGQDGADGFSPTVEVSTITGGHNVVITDAEGDHSFDVMDGADGQPGTPGADGEPGADGQDGISPTVSVTTIPGGHRITIVDAEGTHVADVMDGAGSGDMVSSVYDPNGYAQDIFGYADSIGDSKQDVITDLATIRAGASAGATAVQPESGKGLFSGSYNDLTNKPTIPSAVTESTVSGWGFTKNTGTYSKPSTGIPKSDLSSAVQTSLNLADSALQSYTETDPTVPAWAKEDSKPDYSAGEIAFGGTNVYDELIEIGSLISDQATATNKLVSASEMGDAIMAVEAKQLYATSAQGSFATKAALTGTSVFYNADGTVATPTKNDVAYVLADESHGGKSAKYVVASTNPIVWGFVITFSDATFTQTQMDAVNSGITSAKRAGYDNHVADSTIHVTSADKTAWNGKENASNKVNTISATSTVVQYPSAKAVYDYIQSLDASEVSY